MDDNVAINAGQRTSWKFYDGSSGVIKGPLFPIPPFAPQIAGTRPVLTIQVPGPGLEPGSPFRAGDFKSPENTTLTSNKYSDLDNLGKSDTEIIRRFIDQTGHNG